MQTFRQFLAEDTVQPLHTSAVAAALKAADKLANIRTRRVKRAGYRLRQHNRFVVALFTDDVENPVEAMDDFEAILTAAGFIVKRPMGNNGVLMIQQRAEPK